MSQNSPDWPKWMQSLLKLIRKHWSYDIEGRCREIHLVISPIGDKSGWRIAASPVHREYYGSEIDGEWICPMLFFDVSGFMREPGIWAKDVAVLSSVDGHSPSICFTGKFRGHRLLFVIYLEPVQSSEPGALFDSITKEFRPKNTEGETP